MSRDDERFGRFTREDLEEIAGYRLGQSPRMGFGEQCAVVVVDFTRDVVKSRPEVRRAAEQTALMLAAARRAKLPIFFTRGGRHYHSVSFAQLTDAEKGNYAVKSAGHYVGNPLAAEDFEIADQIAPQSGEVVITKHRGSAFEGTFLAQMLIWHRVDTLIIPGMSSGGCQYETVVSACSHNYRVIVPRECCAIGGGTSAMHYLNLLHMDSSRADVTPLAAVMEHLERLSEIQSDLPPQEQLVQSVR